MSDLDVAEPEHQVGGSGQAVGVVSLTSPRSHWQPNGSTPATFTVSTALGSRQTAWFYGSATISGAVVDVWTTSTRIQHLGQTLQVQVANRDHPITRSLTGWTMGDETYTMAEAGPSSEILLTVAHPRSMRTLAWTRQFKQSRVFCFQSGHDNVTWANPAFPEILQRGLR